MARIHVNLRLRPIRFAFLVAPNDMTELHRVFQLNTVLWGGRYNVVIPGWRRCPPEHEGEGTGGEIVRRFLEAVEPDFVVVGHLDPKAFGIDVDRVVHLDEMLENPNLPHGGLGVLPLYRWLYDTEWKFQVRHPRTLVHVEAPSTVAAFCAARYGQIPPGPWASCAAALHELGASSAVLDESSYSEKLLRCLHPIALGSNGLDRRAWRRTAFLVMNAQKYVDLVDYWNLRAFGWEVLPLPVPWLTSMVQPTSTILVREHRPARPYRRDVTAGHVIRAPSVASDVFDEFVRKLNVPAENRIVQKRTPRYSRQDCWDQDLISRPNLCAGERGHELQSESGRISFQMLAPQFANLTIGCGLAQWANTISLQSWDVPELAEAIPRTLSNLAQTLSGGYHQGSYRCSSEGITVLGHGNSGHLSWKLPDGRTVFEEHLKDRFKVEVSTSGRLALRMIHMLGGPEWTLPACKLPMIELFRRATTSSSRSVNLERFRNGIAEQFPQRKEVAVRLIDRWVEAGVVAVGLDVPCAECGQMNWYPVDGLDTTLKCNRCLGAFRFPASRPPTSWAVRPLGPFAVEGACQGNFTVALAIRFFRLFGGDPHTTWLPGMLLTDPKGLKREIDFAMLWQSSLPDAWETDLLLGECKTRNLFQKKDAERMSDMAGEFPGSYLVFASLTDALTAEEIRIIRPIALRGRREWRNPVIVLTNRELTGHSHPPACWDASPREKAVSHECSSLMSLRAVADATQQLYLEIPPGAGWPHRPWWEDHRSSPRSDPPPV